MIKVPPTTFWRRFRFIGPSLILTATLIGSGELIVTTTYGAQAGFKALWLIIAACFLKVAIQESLGRYTISSGDTSLVALDRLPGPNDGSEEWLQRARGWIRVMQLDCYFAMVVYTVTTIAFYLLGAAVLHPQGIVPEGTQVITTLSAMYTDTFGLGAYWVFITCSFLVLLSTLLFRLHRTDGYFPTASG